MNKKNVRICVASCRTPIIPADARVDDGTTPSIAHATAPATTTPFTNTPTTQTQTGWPGPSWPWEDYSCDYLYDDSESVRDSRFTCVRTSTPSATTPTPTAGGATLTPITVVEYPHLVYDIETNDSDYVVLGRNKFRFRCKCPRSDPDRACDWYQSDIKITEDFLNQLQCAPPGDGTPLTTPTVITGL